MERTNVFFEFDLNEYSVLVALLVNGKDSCRNGTHICHFLGQTSPEMEPPSKSFRHGKAPEEEKEYNTVALVFDKVQRYRRTRFQWRDSARTLRDTSVGANSRVQGSRKRRRRRTRTIRSLKTLPNIVFLQKLPASVNVRLVEGSIANLLRCIHNVAGSN